MEERTSTPLVIGGITATPIAKDIPRFSGLFWGTAGSGKTTLASTSRGHKLWINFDADGLSSLKGAEDITVLDLSDKAPDVVLQFKQNDPLNLSAALKQNPYIKCVVVDSVTAFAQQAIAHGYTSKAAPGATFENPGPAGYGIRNRFSLALVKNVLRATALCNVDVIFICHEDVPVRDKEGNVIGYTLLLGGSLPEEVPLQISEVWHVADVQIKRRITIRSTQMRKPMKTRMFRTDGPIEFDWKYNANTGEGPSLRDWQADWEKNNYSKIPVPS